MVPVDKGESFSRESVFYKPFGTRITLNKRQAKNIQLLANKERFDP